MRYTLAKRPRGLLDELLTDEFFTGFGYGKDIDIYRENDNYIVELEIPGFNKENINIEYKGNILTITADHEEVVEDEQKDYYYRSRRFNNYSRQIKFDDVDAALLEASYDKGVLKIVLPTKTKEETVNRIEIK